MKKLLFISLLFIVVVSGCTSKAADPELQEGDIVVFDVSYVELKTMARTARIAGDPSLCDQIPIYAGGIKRWCLEAIEYDKQIRTDPARKSVTYNLDPEYCTEIQPRRINECLLSLAMNTGDPIHCQEIEDLDSKDRCLTELAAEIGDIELCDVETDQRKRLCPEMVASATLNPSYCDLAINKELCLGGVDAAKPRVHKKFLE